jgi:hypothetical protein
LSITPIPGSGNFPFNFKILRRKQLNGDDSSQKAYRAEHFDERQNKHTE